MLRQREPQQHARVVVSLLGRSTTGSSTTTTTTTATTTNIMAPTTTIPVGVMTRRIHKIMPAQSLHLPQHRTKSDGCSVIPHSNYWYRTVTKKIRMSPFWCVVVFILLCCIYHVYTDSCSRIGYDACYNPFHFVFIDDDSINQTLLRFQKEYYQNNRYTTTTASSTSFPRWPTVKTAATVLVADHGGTQDHDDRAPVDDYFHPLLSIIQTALRQPEPGNGTTTTTSDRYWDTTTAASKLPYDAQPSFQNIYIITTTTTTLNTGGGGGDSKKSPLQLYKYTLPNTQTQMVRDRARYTESFLWQMLYNARWESDTTPVEYHHSFRTALEQYGGIIFVMSYTDSQFCGNTKATSVPLPILTLSAPMDCPYAFPIPTYETIIYTQKLETSKRKRIIPIQFMDRYILYPWWYRRYDRAVWRGSPTGSTHMDQNPRWQLCATSQQHPRWIDAKFVGTTQRWPMLANYQEYVGRHMSIRDMQQYRAVIDVDGNSWSSRFGTLLCQSSVVLKVQPKYVDYFYPTLEPWKHYIPVREDLSDLLELVQLATSYQHSAIVQQIIYNANEWCRHHMTISHLRQDMMSILDTYAAKIMLPAPDDNSFEPGNNHNVPLLLIPRLLQQHNFTRVQLLL